MIRNILGGIVIAAILAYGVVVGSWMWRVTARWDGEADATWDAHGSKHAHLKTADELREEEEEMQRIEKVFKAVSRVLECLDKESK